MFDHNLASPEDFQATTLGVEDRISAIMKLLLPPNVKHGLGLLRGGKSRLTHGFAPGG